MTKDRRNIAMSNHAAEHRPVSGSEVCEPYTARNCRPMIRRTPSSTVDVFIPSYQYGTYLSDCATSVLSQQVPSLRLLIIDNASTDGSREIAQGIAAADDRVTVVLNEQNRGWHHSFNRAIDWACSDYFMILGADDLLPAGALDLEKAFLDEHPEVAFAYGVEARLADGLLDSGRCDAARTRWNVVKGEEFIRRTCFDSFCDVGSAAWIIRTSALKEAGADGHYRSALRTADFEMYLRLAMVGDVASCNRVLGIRRIHDAEMSAPYNKQRVLDFEDHEAAFGSFFAHEGTALPGAGELLTLSRRAMGDYAYWYGLSQLLHGRDDAKTAFAFAAERRRLPTWVPPLGFLAKKRWLRSMWRAGRRVVHPAKPLDPGLKVPAYF
ncbi:glycosyltransferase family 2 protein [Mycobacterium manitobense]|uniref:Glycosyltransferase family 2 protein n=1 Tax=[Mycobacterium] manitobense TaxID=190147 RepID=A0A9X3BNU7_9MYCO|nr:glycosyltransferase family A protein [[Mycobacterium] manitobense]MCV7171929.1 glycosyltransferase family 2 protein [[Mycobacterium] manitobense]